jgi:hypothetical protein
MSSSTLSDRMCRPGAASASQRIWCPAARSAWPKATSSPTSGRLSSSNRTSPIRSRRTAQLPVTVRASTDVTGGASKSRW